LKPSLNSFCMINLCLPTRLSFYSASSLCISGQEAPARRSQLIHTWVFIIIYNIWKWWPNQYKKNSKVLWTMVIRD
jgi:hypothetical protein